MANCKKGCGRFVQSADQMCLACGDAPFGYIVRVVTKDGDFWLAQRIYMRHEAAITVKHNLMFGGRPYGAGRYTSVYVLPATEDQRKTALSVLE